MSKVKCLFDNEVIECTVIENMGWQGGNYVKSVDYNGEERIVIKIGGIYKPKLIQDKIEFTTDYTGM